ncbi:MAG: PLP-dependent aminotransferase family protein [Pseudomonadota bacterium]
MSRHATFDGAPPEGTINLGVGQPSADLLPVDLLRGASGAFFAAAHPFDLNYGERQGDARFREQLARFLTRHYGSPTSAGELLVTGGNSQALGLVANVFARPGATVLVEDPSYFLAFKILRDHGLNLVGVDMDDEGPCLKSLEVALAHHRPAFFYTIPSYQNPTGICSSAERRAAIVALAQQYGTIIVADEPYQLLHYYDAPPPALGTMVDSGAVISLGSFSKILAPALRLGWLQASDALLERISLDGVINSGGALNHIGSHIARHALANGRLDAHIEGLRSAYRSRLEAMDSALQEHFSELATWSTPAGGYFVWLRFDGSVDTASLKSAALDLQTGFTPGPLCSPDGRGQNCLRLSFAHYGEAAIRTAIARLRRLFER